MQALSKVLRVVEKVGIIVRRLAILAFAIYLSWALMGENMQPMSR